MGFMEEPYVSLAYVHVAKQIRVPPNSDYVAPPAGYGLANVSVGFATHVKQKKLQLDLTVANATNVRYRDYLDKFRYYADNLGINVILRSKITF